MPQKQNPTTNGNRALWNALDSASTETHSLSCYRAQHLIGSYGIRTAVAPIFAALAFGGGARHD